MTANHTKYPNIYIGKFQPLSIVYSYHLKWYITYNKFEQLIATFKKLHIIFSRPSKTRGCFNLIALESSKPYF